MVVFFSTVISNLSIKFGKSTHLELSLTSLILYVILLYSPKTELINNALPPEPKLDDVKVFVSINLVSSLNIGENVVVSSLLVDGSTLPSHPYSLMFGTKKFPRNKLPFGLKAERFNKFGPIIFFDVCIAATSFSPLFVLILNLYLPFVGIPTLGLFENINSPNSFVVT